MSRSQIIDSPYKLRVLHISHTHKYMLHRTNTVVTSKMKMVTGRGPDKMSLVKEYTPLLLEEVD